jgi:hypothetical protein
LDDEVECFAEGALAYGRVESSIAEIRVRAKPAIEDELDVGFVAEVICGEVWYVRLEDVVAEGKRTRISGP